MEISIRFPINALRLSAMRMIFDTDGLDEVPDKCIKNIFIKDMVYGKDGVG
jgi:hypothetical protein